MTDRPWTFECGILRKKCHLGAKEVHRLINEACDAQDPPVSHRSIRAVRMAAARMGVSLRRSGERRGLAVGQPVGVKRSEFVKQDGKQESSTLADSQYRGLNVTGLEARYSGDICPCGEWPIADNDQGVCERCWKRHLNDKHLAETKSIQTAQRMLWGERQRKVRLRGELFELLIETIYANGVESIEPRPSLCLFCGKRPPDDGFLSCTPCRESNQHAFRVDAAIAEVTGSASA